MPIGFASGCITEYNGQLILMTVHHATGNNGNWAAEVRYVRGKGTKLYQLGAMNFLSRINLDISGGFHDIDFAYVKVPQDFESFYQEIQPNGNVSLEENRIHCDIDFDADPVPERDYGFSGLVLPELADYQLGSELKVYRGLRFIDTKDDYHIFKLPFNHPGHEHFKGCSGAPIIDDQGKTVALVCKGVFETNTIHAISLKKYQIAFQISFG